jgi:hypothetical protein
LSPTTEIVVEGSACNSCDDKWDEQKVAFEVMAQLMNTTVKNPHGSLLERRFQKEFSDVTEDDLIKMRVSATRMQDAFDYKKDFPKASIELIIQAVQQKLSNEELMVLMARQ